MLEKIPQTTDEFYIALGNALAMHIEQGMFMTRTQRIAAARTWCAEHMTELGNMTKVLDRAVATTNPTFVLALALANNEHGMFDLTSVEPRYLARLYAQCLGLSWADLRRLLLLMQKIAA